MARFPAEKTPRRLQDNNSADTAFRVRTLVLALPGAFFGALLGAYFTARLGLGSGLGMLVGAVAGVALIYFAVRWLAEWVAHVGAGVLLASAARTPAPREYSLAQAHAANGRFDDAVREYERCAAAFADDAEPCIRLARLLRDEMARPDDAIDWFRRGLGRRVEPAAEPMLIRELIEVYSQRLHAPRRALPDLARLAARFPGTPAGIWAARELTVIRESLRSDHEA